MKTNTTSCDRHLFSIKRELEYKYTCDVCGAMTGEGISIYDSTIGSDGSITFFTQVDHSLSRSVTCRIINGNFVDQDEWNARMGKLGRLLHE